MGQRHQHRIRLEALEGRWLMSASGIGDEYNARDPETDHNAPAEFAAAEPSAPSLREDNPAAATPPTIRRSSLPKSLAEAMKVLGGKPISPSIDDDSRSDPDEEEQPKQRYQPSHERPSESNTPSESRDNKAEFEKTVRDLPLMEVRVIEIVIPNKHESAKSETVSQGNAHQNSTAGPSFVNSLPPAESVASPTRSRPSSEVVAFESIEIAPALDAADQSNTPVLVEGAKDEPAVQSQPSLQDLVSASPLGATGTMVERLPSEPGVSGELLKEQASTEQTFDLSSAAVTAFWTAVELLPVAPLSHATAATETLIEAVGADFELLSQAVDTLLDSLAAQFDLSGPGRTRDVLFASSAALLAALACEKVRRHQQRLEDENLASMGFDADGCLALAEGQ